MADKDTIGIASDHAGYELKSALKAELGGLGFAALDLGTESGEKSVDYPDFARALAEAMKAGKFSRGVLICGTGIGIGMAANRHAWIRCGVVHDETSARLTRQHNDANVMAVGQRLIGVETAKASLKVFLSTPYEGGRHVQRVAKLA
ncbi:MAG: ribose 5-phosphate isomerase B [Alphaproteobacteria bacterium]|nr:ribose 5-phosphate isomerase B [Alphaproteobacteria bacterium]